MTFFSYTAALPANKLYNSVCKYIRKYMQHLEQYYRKSIIFNNYPKAKARLFFKAIHDYLNNDSIAYFRTPTESTIHLRVITALYYRALMLTKSYVSSYWEAKRRYRITHYTLNVLSASIINLLKFAYFPSTKLSIISCF